MPTEVTRPSPPRRSQFRAQDRRLVPFLTCPYCAQTFGPWGREPIEPCPLCRRPLHRSIGWKRRPQIVPLLSTINALQGVGMMLATALFIIGPMSPHQLCGCVALALFVAATSYIVDGALAWRSRISRAFGQILTGREARLAGAATVIFGTGAMLLSMAGMAYLFMSR